MSKPVIPVMPFKVCVTRHCKSGKSESYNGTYVSDVYAIDVYSNSFLVYDPGDADTVIPGFEWVCFTDTMTSLKDDVEVESVVTLYKE